MGELQRCYTGLRNQDGLVDVFIVWDLEKGKFHPVSMKDNHDTLKKLWVLDSGFVDRLQKYEIWAWFPWTDSMICNSF